MAKWGNPWYKTDQAYDLKEGSASKKAAGEAGENPAQYPLL